MKTYPVCCNKDCGGGCALAAHVSGDRIVKITNSHFAPKYMTGCRMGFNTDKFLYSPERLTAPLLRNGRRGSGGFKEISWENAFDIIAEKFASFREEYGFTSILQLEGGGGCHGAFHNTIPLSKRFFNMFGPCPCTYGSYSSTAQRFVTPYVLGTNETGLDPETLFNSKLIILWGANLSDTRLSAKIESVLLEIKKQGIPIVVIDPRRTTTAVRFATEWIQVYPGTDTVLQLAILFCLIENRLTQSDFIRKYSIGFDELSEYVTGRTDNTPKTPEWAEKLCGTPASTIRRLADIYGRTKPAALIPGLSIQRTIGGEEAYRLNIALQTCTGNLGIPGGSSGGRTWHALSTPACPKLPVPLIKNDYVIPVYKWADAILKNGEYGNWPDIRMIYHTGGNYIMQGADVKKNIRAYEKIEFAVCHDCFMTPTAKYSDIILPVAMWPEREDIILAPDNCLLYSAKAVEPPTGIKTDYEIFCGLASRLGFVERYSEKRTASEWIDFLLQNSEIRDIQEFKRTSIYNGWKHDRVAFSDFISDPVKNRLNTPSGLVEISSGKYFRETGFPKTPEAVLNLPDAEYPLRLITPHSKNRVNSSNGNVPFFADTEDDSLWMNPADASLRNLSDKENVRIFNDIGLITARIRLTDDIMRGVVSLCQGQWPANINSDITSGPLANMLAPTEPTRPSMGSRTHSIFVEVGKSCWNR